MSEQAAGLEQDRQPLTICQSPFRQAMPRCPFQGGVAEPAGGSV